MNKFAVVFAAASVLALSACGEKPANEAANVTNEVVVNEMENSANAMDNAANAMTNAAEATANVANAVGNAM